MDNSRFSTLIYRIIGKPEKWHDDYIDVMHQILDETDSFDDPENFGELAVGDQILSRIANTNEALNAFGTLLDKSRFKMIILDEHFTPIYHNQNADDLMQHVQSKSKPGQLDLFALNKVKEAAAWNKEKAVSGLASNLSAMDYSDQHGDQVYLRSIQNQLSPEAQVSTFYLMLVLDRERNESQLNPGLIERYEITDKEQNVLLKLIHGKSIKEIAESSFVSENTVKTHLKALFRKTETKSQADIIRLVLTHESQILDSYFGTTAGILSTRDSAAEEKFVTLDSGLKVAYREYGPSDGKPVLMCHNGYGCRLTIPKNYAEVCAKHNRRIIIPDRPGFGLTPYVKGHPNGWVDCMQELVDKLQFSEFELLGSVLGCCFALEFAAQADSRLTRVLLASPVFVNTRKDANYLTGILAPSVRLVRASKRFAREIYELWLKSVTLNLATHYRSMLDKSMGSVEREQFLRDGTLDLMVEGFEEGSSRSLEGISHEMVYCISPRKIDLNKVTAPVSLWWGTEDNRISREGVENLAKQLPHSTVQIREGYSEHIYYSLLDEILADQAS